MTGRGTSYSTLPRSNNRQEIDCGIKHTRHVKDACTRGLDRNQHWKLPSQLTGLPNPSKFEGRTHRACRYQAFTLLMHARDSGRLWHPLDSN